MTAGQPTACVAMPTPHDSAGVAALFDRLMQALNENDGSLLSGVFTADLMLIDAFGRRLTDWEDAARVFGALFETEVPTWTMTCTVLRIMMIDRNIAIVNTMHHLAAATTSISNVTSVVIRRGGRWWIASSHSGPFEPVRTTQAQPF